MRRLSTAEAAAYTLGPDSISWQTSSDVRSFFGSGYALLLQVAHPTISAGVRDHSNFTTEPWQRLLRTLDYVNLTVYGGDDAVEVTRRLREMHKRIKGTNSDGGRYHALEPEAYAWVQATLVKAIIDTNRLFVGTMTDDDCARLYDEWRGLATLLGVRDGDLPESYAGLDGYVARMVDERLTCTESVRDVLDSIRRPARPPVVPGWAQPLWRAGFRPVSGLLLLVAAGLLPPALRQQFGLPWGPWRRQQLAAIAAASRSLTPVLPRSLLITGPDYLEARRKHLPYDEFAPAHLRAPASAPADG